MKKESVTLKSVSGKIDSLITVIGSVDTKMKSLTTKIGSMDTKVKSITTKVDSLGVTVTTLSVNLDSLTTIVDNLAASTKRGFDETAKKVDVDKQFGEVNERLDRIEHTVNKHDNRLDHVEDNMLLVKTKVGIR